MSYQCEKCKATQPHGTPSNRIVVETREKVYPRRGDDPGGKGFETVREMVVCPECDKPTRIGKRQDVVDEATGKTRPVRVCKRCGKEI